MDGRIQRFGIRIGRGWVVLFLIAGSLLLGAYWIGPLRPIPARIELLAIDGDVAVPQIAVRPRGTAGGGLVFPIAVAARNVGAQSARPSSLVLSVPPQFGIATTRGRITGVATAGVPLRRYPIALGRSELRPDSQTVMLPGLDTIYLEPDLPRYYCTTQGGTIPEFSSAPRYNAHTLSDIRIFYSFMEAGRAERQTGLLTVQIDPALLEVAPAANPPTFPTVVEIPAARAPETGTLLFAGARTAHCGDPEQPVELYTTLWETRMGGRVFVVYVDNVGRKRLYDMDRDGIIELETWDSDGDGLFESRREARYAIPEFLIPLPPRDPSMTQPDPVPPDDQWLALFHNAARGPSRFARSTLTPHPPIAAVDTAGADAASADTAAAPRVAETGPQTSDPDLRDVRPATPEFLALFADTAAGPFRFAERPRALPAAQAPPAAGTPAFTPLRPTLTADSAAPAEPEPEPEPPPRPRRRQPLGTPIVPPR
jgi:hypothetical protein